MDIAQAKELIMECGRRMWARGMVAANDGNISCRFGEGFLITRSCVSKGFLCPSDILLVDGAGKVISPVTSGGRSPLDDDGKQGVPSMETFLHLAIYGDDPAVGAIVHSHAPYATAFAAAKKDINGYRLEDLRLQIGPVALAPYAPAGSMELAKVTAEAVRGHKAALMTGHGVIVTGADMREAYYRMEALEQAAKIIILSEGLK